MPHLPDDQGRRATPSVDGSHATHDRLLIAAYAAGDVDEAALAEAERLIRRCAECARLADDLRAIAASLPEAALPRRPRDFRLDEATAQRARGRGLGWSWARLSSTFRPAGAALATLGLAGLLLAGVTGLGNPGSRILSTVGSAVTPVSGGAGRDLDSSDSGGAGAPAAAPSAAAGGVRASAAASAVSEPASSGQAPEVVGTPASSQPAATQPAASRSAPGSSDKSVGGPFAGPVQSPPPPPGPSPLVVVSIAALALGVILLAASRLRSPEADEAA